MKIEQPRFCSPVVERLRTIEFPGGRVGLTYVLGRFHYNPISKQAGPP